MSAQVRTYRVEFSREEDGRWIADIPELPGVLVYGSDRDDAFRNAVTLAMSVIAERLAHGEAPLDFSGVEFVKAA